MNATLANLRPLLLALGFYLRFILSFTQIGYAVRRLFWRRSTADFRGQHWLVTGGSGGIGRALVFAGLRGGATVTAAARNPDKLRELAAATAAAGLGGLQLECCDLTSVADTDALIARLARSTRQVDVLMNNVGVLNDEPIVTGEGLEASFVSNLLSHFQLTEALIAAGALRTGSVVINVSSGGGYLFPLMTAALNVIDPQRYRGVAAYGFHKRAQMSLNQHWREHYGPQGMTFFVMHPGWADTAGVERSLPRFRKLLGSALRDTESAADTAVWLAATRPAQPSPEGIWFDHKLRPAHVYGHTRTTTETAATLADFMQRQLKAIRDAR